MSRSEALLDLPPRLRSDLVGLARHAAPYEACGVLWRLAEGRLGVATSPNVHPEPRHNFRIGEAEQLRILSVIEANGGELVGIFHSHPNADAEPSQSDLEYAAGWPGLVWVIVGLGGSEPVISADVLVP